MSDERLQANPGALDSQTAISKVEIVPADMWDEFVRPYYERLTLIGMQKAENMQNLNRIDAKIKGIRNAHRTIRGKALTTQMADHGSAVCELIKEEKGILNNLWDIAPGLKVEVLTNYTPDSVYEIKILPDGNVISRWEDTDRPRYYGEIKIEYAMYFGEQAQSFLQELVQEVDLEIQPLSDYRRTLIEAGNSQSKTK